MNVEIGVQREMALNYFLENMDSFKKKFTVSELESIDYQIGRCELSQPDLEELLK